MSVIKIGKTLLVIDAGYLLHYRWHATARWMSFQNEDFTIAQSVSTFKNHLNAQIAKLQKKYKTTKEQTVFCLDAPLRNVWRTQIYPEYKSQRPKSEIFVDAPNIFEEYYEILRERGITVSHPHLEADDCAALLVENVRAKSDSAEIVIVTSDADYIQLKKHNVLLINGAGKELPMIHPDPDVCKWIKIVSGDKSDFIPPAFPKCGPKTALKIAVCPVYRAEITEKHGAGIERNRTLVDFERIPEDLRGEFLQTITIQ